MTSFFQKSNNKYINKYIYKVSIIPCIIKNILLNNFEKADQITRIIAKNTYNSIKNQDKDIARYIDEITGGIGYRRKMLGKDWERVVLLGCYIAWADAVQSNEKVLEIGTGLGRTNYCIQYNKPMKIHSIDNDQLVIGIALYSNPYPEFQEYLWRENVKIFLGDALCIIRILSMKGVKYDHIVHDGGPCPAKNPILYSYDFFSSLDKLLKPGGRISVFGGKNPKIIKKIYSILKELGYEAYTVSPPGIRVFIIRGVKWS